jgi:hypothetical protein
VYLAPGFRGDLGNNFETLGIEHVVGPEILFGRLFQRDDGHFFEHQAVGGEALADALLDLLGKAVAVLVQLPQRFFRGETAQRADDFRLKKITDFFSVEGLFAERAACSQNGVLGMADVRIQFGIHVDADVVGRQDRLLAGPADRKLDGLQRYPAYLVKNRQHDRTAAQAHLGTEKAGADEAHIRRRTLIDPNRDDVEDRDKDDRGDQETDYYFKHRAFAPIEVLALPLPTLTYAA